MKITRLSVLMLLLFCASAMAKLPETKTFTKVELLNKIKGGWAGQTIGVTYGGPTEFKYKGVLISDTASIPWNDDYIKWYYDTYPGLYDDLYMDLTFVQEFERLGLDAPVNEIAKSFANAEFMLWHANQAARYNILNGIMPPASGYWKNNLHSACIDFQIEADFAGLMSPGMTNTASGICDKVGHIMNYGDGWYGGVYVAAMYSLAFVSDDVDFIVREALKAIPSQSHYYQCMTQVLDWCEKYPQDWKKVWNEVEKSSWYERCPEGVDDPFNIEATVNSAYVLIGLLYGKGDFAKSMDIATRCGQDSDCNPSTVCGILGVVLGYDKIPSKWLNPLHKVEDIDFKYTTMSLNNTYEVGMKHALAEITAHGGKINGNDITVKVQNPVPVRLEQVPVMYTSKEVFTPEVAFANKKIKGIPVDRFKPYTFIGTGIAVNGKVTGDKTKNPDYVADVDFLVDGKVIKNMKLPMDRIKAATELFWCFDLVQGSHTLELKWKNQEKGMNIFLENVIKYSDKPDK